MKGGREFTLLSTLDHTQTPMGSRLLARWLNQPIRCIMTLNQRLDTVEELCDSGEYDLFNPILRNIGDLERIVSRIALQNARPRDLVRLKEALEHIPALKKKLEPFHCSKIQAINQALNPHTDIFSILQKALVENPPVVIRDGGVIAPGYDAELDELKTLSQNANDFLIALEAKEKKETGLSTLKVEYNRVHGFYIELSKAQSVEIPSHYTRRQTLKNVERPITPE